MKFPVYRKYSNNKSYFKVLSANEFEEIVVLGKNYWVYNFTTKILPDHHLIKDMIDMLDGRWEFITEKEYYDFSEKCSKEFKKQN